MKSIPFRSTLGLPHRFFTLLRTSTGMTSRDLTPGQHCSCPTRYQLSYAVPFTLSYATPYWATPHLTLSYTPYPTELRRTLNWATPNPSWAAPHPIWATPHPIWAMPHPKITKGCLSILKTRILDSCSFFTKGLTRTLFYYLVLAEDVSFEQEKLKGYNCSKLALKLFKLSQYRYNHTYIQLCRMDGVKGDGTGKFLRQNVQLNTAP
jgi:hypothetical protein